MRWTEFRRKIEKKGVLLFTPPSVSPFFGGNHRIVRNFLYRQTKGGNLVRLKRGLYMLADRPAPDFHIANKLYEPSYISLETALSFHGIIPETVYTVTSVTTKKTRNFEVNGIVFSYHHIKREAFTGYVPLPYLGTTIFMAEGEKAILDYLYLSLLDPKALSSRLDRLFERPRLSGVSKEKLKHDAQPFADKRLFSLIEEKIP